MWDPTSIEKIKRYLKLTEGLDADDVLLEEIIDRAEDILESLTHRRFKAMKETRVYDCPDDRCSLLLDGDLQKVIRLSNGDGVEIPTADFRYTPANRGEGNDRRPAFALQLVNDAYFTYDTNPVQCIKVRGWWGYSMEPDYYTEQTLIRLVCYLYKQKDSQVFDSTAFLDGGVMVIPQGMPKSVAEFIQARGKIYR